MDKEKPAAAVTDADGLADDEPRCGEMEAEQPTKERAQADQQLAARCLAGEVAAWEELYAQCHAPLVVSIRMMLNGYTTDANLVDEIAARVWYALVDDDGALLTRYSPKRGARLVTFMRALAKDIICRHFRTERRRQKHEAAATREKRRQAFGNSRESASSVSEFLTTLTPEEKTFCDEFLLDRPPDGQNDGHAKRSRPTLWRWTQRVYGKLLRFLDGDAGPQGVDERP